MVYENIEKFYRENSRELLLENGIYRPVKSITRNIFNSVQNFYNWYYTNSRNTITYQEISDEICSGVSLAGESTIVDNIRNMKELAFLVEDNEKPNVYHFTKSFVSYVINGDDLSDTINNNLRKISSLNQMTMFYNYILCTLREGYLLNKITEYPDSEEKFKNKVRNKQERIEILQNIDDIYGFHGNSSSPANDDYTPNIIYRILSTVKQLGLVEKGEKDRNNLQTYNLSIKGKEILNQIEWNLALRNRGAEAIKSYERSEKFLASAIQMNPDDIGSKNIQEQLREIIYELRTDECCPSLILDESIDKPTPVSTLTTSYNRDPQKAANAKAIADYKCELDELHETFTSEVSNNQYVEAHHLIPISKQGEFQVGIDIEANIVALCPTCHRKIHSAIIEEKKEMIKILYDKRIDRLRKCGIDLTLEKLESFYTND